MRSQSSRRMDTATFVVACSCIGGLLFGYDTGVISGAQPYIAADLLAGNSASSNAAALGAIVSAAIWAAAVGASAGGRVADAIGRRSALAMADAFFILGALCMAAAWSVPVLIVGRLLVGLGVGIASIVVPVYIAEVSAPRVRARAVAGNVLAITGGQLLAYIVNYLLSYVAGTWRWMLGVAALPAVLQLLLLPAIPESPRWLLGQGREAECKAVVRAIMEPSEVAAQLESMAAEVQRERERVPRTSKGTLGNVLEVFRSRVARAQLHVGVTLQALQQLAGINTVMYFTPLILQMAGFTDPRQALLLACAPAAVNAGGTILGMHLVERMGRRKLLLASLTGVVASLVALSVPFWLGARAPAPVLPAPPEAAVQPCDATPAAPAVIDSCAKCIAHVCTFCAGGGEAEGGNGWCVSNDSAAECSALPGRAAFAGACPNPYRSALLAGIMLYLVTFSTGMGPIPWVINAEIYSLEIRGFASGLAGTANWVTNALVSEFFLLLTTAITPAGTFLLCAAVAAAGTLWAYLFVPETKGLSLAEVQALFARRAGGSEAWTGGPGGHVSEQVALVDGHQSTDGLIPRHVGATFSEGVASLDVDVPEA